MLSFKDLETLLKWTASTKWSPEESYQRSLVAASVTRAKSSKKETIGARTNQRSLSAPDL